VIRGTGQPGPKPAQGIGGHAALKIGRGAVSTQAQCPCHEVPGPSRFVRRLDGGPQLDRPPQRAAGGLSAAGEPNPHERAAPTLGGLLDRLPEPQKEIIALAFYGGLTHTEIEELLALPPGTVKGRMRLGLAKLRLSLGEATGVLQ